MIIFINLISFGMVCIFFDEHCPTKTKYFGFLDWVAGMPIPFDITMMYFVQCGFYLHSIYGTLYMDYKRKDFYAMLIHHVLTMALIFVSYATR